MRWAPHCISIGCSGRSWNAVGIASAQNRFSVLCCCSFLSFFLSSFLPFFLLFLLLLSFLLSFFLFFFFLLSFFTLYARVFWGWGIKLWRDTCSGACGCVAWDKEGGSSSVGQPKTLQFPTSTTLGGWDRVGPGSGNVSLPPAFVVTQ